MLKFRAFLFAVALASPSLAAPAFAAQAPQPSAPSAPAAQGAPSARPSGGVQPYCGGIYQIGPPANLPPAGSGPVVYQVGVCFEKQGGSSTVDPQTYLYYI